MQLDERRPAAGERIRTFSRTSSGVVDDAEAQASGGRPMRRGLAGDLAATAGRGDVGAGALHPRAGRPATVDRVAQRDVDERPERSRRRGPW